MPPKKAAAASLGEEDKKRKAEKEANNTRPKKMSKEERAAARERARVAMKQDSSAPAAKKKATPAKAKASTGPKAALKAAPPASSGTRKSPKRAAKTAKSATAKVTIAEEKAPDPTEMPLPPTTLQRTQSTPLELELEHQVVANLKADMEGKDPVFTDAPPAHLLKFAPKELEDGYDHDETNVGDPDEKPMTEISVTQRSSFKSSHIMEFLLLGVWIYLFWGREGTFYHRWTHGILANIPISGNPYRTATGKPIPFLPCFETNVDDPPVALRAECVDIPPEACPPLGSCYGGHLQACEAPYLMAAPNRKTCQMLPPIQNIYDKVVSRVSTWSMDYACDHQPHGQYAKLFENYDESPAPYMMVSMRDTSPPSKQPMFALQHILDLDPFMLMKVPHGGYGANPMQSLHHVVETANNVADHWLKLQILTKYGDAHPETGERAVHQVHLVARVPSKQVWWRRQVSVKTQCSIARGVASIEFVLRTPWLIGVWVACMIVFVVWVFVMRYYWTKAQQQQQVLAAIEVVRGFVLETLETSAPKKWKGTELQEYVVRNGPPLEEALLRKRIWPRVVFDIRGNPSVEKNVIVAGGNLVDVWCWQQEQAAAQAPEEAGGS